MARREGKTVFYCTSAFGWCGIHVNVEVVTSRELWCSSRNVKISFGAASNPQASTSPSNSYITVNTFERADITCCGLVSIRRENRWPTVDDRGHIALLSREDHGLIDSNFSNVHVESIPAKYALHFSPIYIRRPQELCRHLQ